MDELVNIENKVNHPTHYLSEGGLEVIDIIEEFVEDVESFDVGNIIKYVCRYKKKNGVEDLKKARWYLEHLINHIEGAR